MDAIEYLSQQHHDLRDLFEKVELSTGSERRRAFERLADLLELHTRLEERIYYPAARASRTRELIDQSFHDHSEMSKTIEALREIEPEDPHFKEKLRELRIQFHSHIEQEEEVLFPKSRTWLGMRKLRELGETLQVEAEELSRGGGTAGSHSDTHRPWT